MHISQSSRDSGGSLRGKATSAKSCLQVEQMAGTHKVARGVSAGQASTVLYCPGRSCSALPILLLLVSAVAVLLSSAAVQ